MSKHPTTAATAAKTRPAARTTRVSLVENLEGRQFFDATLGTAVNVGPVNEFKQFNDSVSTFADQDDYRRITLPQAGNFTARLTGMSSDADLYLYNSGGGYIDSSTTSGPGDDVVDRFLPAGTYFVNVHAYSGATGYALKLSNDTTGNSFVTAKNIGYAVQPAKVITAAVGQYDADDYYKFNVAAPGYVDVSVSGQSHDVDLYLYNNGGTQVAASSFGGTTTDSVHVYLQPGTYYAKAHSYDGLDTNYTLRVSGPADEAGNSRIAARNLGTLNGNRFANGWVGSTDWDDFYKVQVGANRSIAATISGLSADADLYLYDAAGHQLSASSNGGTLNDSVNYWTGTGGTFYVRVTRYTGDTYYNLDLSAF